jgi:hypothetical protein
METTITGSARALNRNNKEVMNMKEKNFQGYMGLGGELDV